MAPTIEQSIDHVAALVAKRDYVSCDSFGRCYRYSNWSYYGRWILLAVILAVLFIVFFAWACINSRRRRRRGAAPMYGTGWMAPNNGQHQNNPQAYNNAPPAYGAPQSYPMQNQYTGNTFQTQDGYYGGQRDGVQPPKDAHTAPGVNGDFAPPPGPPPGKGHSGL